MSDTQRLRPQETRENPFLRLLDRVTGFPVLLWVLLCVAAFLCGALMRAHNERMRTEVQRAEREEGKR